LNENNEYRGENVILDEEFVSFKIVPDIYSAFYLGYLLGKTNADTHHNYTTLNQDIINLRAKRSIDIVRYIDEMWEVDHLQNIDAVRHDYSATIQYRGLTLWCSPAEVSIINRIVAAAESVRTIYQLQTAFMADNYIMVKLSHDSYIIMSTVAYQHYLTK
jgi:hypothetical protein